MDFFVNWMLKKFFKKKDVTWPPKAMINLVHFYHNEPQLTMWPTSIFAAVEHLNAMTSPPGGGLRTTIKGGHLCAVGQPHNWRVAHRRMWIHGRMMDALYWLARKQIPSAFSGLSPGSRAAACKFPLTWPPLFSWIQLGVAHKHFYSESVDVTVKFIDERAKSQTPADAFECVGVWVDVKQTASKNWQLQRIEWTVEFFYSSSTVCLFSYFFFKVRAASSQRPIRWQRVGKYWNCHSRTISVLYNYDLLNHWIGSEFNPIWLRHPVVVRRGFVL